MNISIGRWNGTFKDTGLLWYHIIYIFARFRGYSDSRSKFVPKSIQQSGPCPGTQAFINALNF